MIYLDNAATTWPKPDRVHVAVLRCLRDVGGSPGRSGHRMANAAERIRLDAREAIAELVGISDPMRIAFMLNATAALNVVMHGLLPPGAHVITTAMEHNSVMRPLRALEARGVALSLAPCAADGSLDPGAIAEQIRATTRLIVVNHASNVCGTILPIRAIGAIAREKGIPLLVDAAQTMGSLPINMRDDNIDLLAFSGHKGLLGPTGTGGLVFSEHFDVGRIEPLVCGGTGSRSEHEAQPDFLPDKYEAGTANMVGIAGLAAGVRYVLDRGLAQIRAHERSLAARLIAGLGEIPDVKIIGTGDADRQTATVSFTVEGQSNSEVAQALDEDHGIMCRPGLQCAPQAHKTLGTLPDGTIRVAPGAFTKTDEVETAINAIRRVVTAR